MSSLAIWLVVAVVFADQPGLCDRLIAIGAVVGGCSVVAVTLGTWLVVEIVLGAQSLDDLLTRIDLVERSLMARLLEIGRTMLEAFVAAQGDGDAGKELPAGDDEVVVGAHSHPFAGMTQIRFWRSRPR